MRSTMTSNSISLFSKRICIWIILLSIYCSSIKLISTIFWTWSSCKDSYHKFGKLNINLHTILTICMVVSLVSVLVNTSTLISTYSRNRTPAKIKIKIFSVLLLLELINVKVLLTNRRCSPRITNRNGSCSLPTLIISKLVTVYLSTFRNRSIDRSLPTISWT